MEVMKRGYICRKGFAVFLPWSSRSITFIASKLTFVRLNKPHGVGKKQGVVYKKVEHD
jgi:hypothetical protein